MKQADRQFLSTARVGKTGKALASFATPESNPGGRAGPQKALAYLRDAAEDSKWPVILAHRALKQVRQLASRDTAAFNIVQLRIR